MAQVSYGTITITDTTDIERIYTVYAKSTANNVVPSMAASSWSESVSSAPGTGNYVWQRTVVLKSGPTSSTNPTYSDPVCLTGEEGTDATQIKNIEVMYGISADWNTQPSSWTANTPAYDSSKPKYWTRTRLVYDTSPETYSTPVYTKDEALTKAVTDAATANSIAQHANEDAQGAMSQAASNINEVKRIWYAQAAATPVPSAPSTEVTTTATHGAWSITKPAANESYPYYFYCDQTKTGGGVCSWSEVILDTSTLSQYQIGALTTKVRNYWWDSAGAHIASGITSSSGEVNKESPTSTYGYNTLTGLTGISFRYNQAKVVDLNSTTPSLDFYTPPTISADKTTATEGKKTMVLSSGALTFYNPTDGQTEQAVLNTNGLVLKKGGIKAGTYSSTSTNFIYLSTEDYSGSSTITIGGNSSGWRQIIGSKFGVKNDGTLYASNAVISGVLNAGVGSTIGPWTVSASAIYNGKTSASNFTTSGVYLGTDGLNISGGTAAKTFCVYKDSNGNVNLALGQNALTWVGSTSTLSIRGTVNALEGSIGGWNILNPNNTNSYGGAIKTGTFGSDGGVFITPGYTYTGTAIGVLPTGQTWTITAGNQFGVTTAGKLYATGANITGTITATSGSFTGAIHATSGEFNGQITAGSGTIGRWQITSTALKTNSGSTSAGMGAESTYAFWAGNETPASAPFRVNYNGTLTATGADITGNIVANSFVAKSYDGSTLKRTMALNTDGIVITDNTDNAVMMALGTGSCQIGKSALPHLFFSTNASRGMQLYNTTTNFVSVTTNNGITLQQDAGNKININVTNGITFYKGDSSNSIANFDSTIRLGKNTERNLRVSNNNLSFYYKDIQQGYLSYSESTTFGGSKSLDLRIKSSDNYYANLGLSTDMTNNRTISSLTSYGQGVYTSNYFQLSVDSTGGVYASRYYTKSGNHYVNINYLLLPEGGMDIHGTCLLTAQYANSQAQYKVQAYDTNGNVVQDIGLLVGSGGTNRGIYDNRLSKWIVCTKSDTLSNKIQTDWGGFVTSSDGKKKNVIGKINYAKDFINALKPVQFYWKDGNEKINLGFVAQEVDQINKELNLNLDIATADYIDESKGIYKGEAVDDKELNWFLSYEEIIAPLVQVVQDQQKEIDLLKKEIQKLK